MNFHLRNVLIGAGSLASALAVAATAASQGRTPSPGALASFAVAAAAFALARDPDRRPRPSWIGPASLLAAAALLVSPSTRMAGVVLAAATILEVLAGILRSGDRLVERAASGMRAAAIAALILSGLQAGWERIETLEFLDVVPLLALRAVLGLAGCRSAFAGNDLLIAAEWGTVPVAGDLWRVTGHLVFGTAAIFAADAFRRFEPRAALARSARFLGLMLLFSLLRFVLLVLETAIAGLEAMRFLLQDGWVILTFAPIPLLAAGLAGRRQPMAPAMAAGRIRLRAAAAALSGLALVVFGLHFHEQGQPRAGRIVLDESHSDFAADAAGSGSGATGGRAARDEHGFSDLLDRWYGIERIGAGDIDSSRLAGAQVVVVRTPTRPYAAPEIAALEEHVESGGGLWLIADPSDRKGSIRHLNDLAERFGFRFDADASLEGPSGAAFVGPQSVVHPVGAESVGMALESVCSITPLRPDFEPILIGRSPRDEPTDPGAEKNGLADRRGAAIQAIAVRQGRGRVAALGAGELFARHRLFEPGASELALRSIEYLSHGPRLPRGTRELAAVLGYGLLAAGAASLARQRLTSRLLVPLGAALAVALTSACETHSLAAATPRNALRPFIDLSFVVDAEPSSPSAAIDDPRASSSAARRVREMGSFVAVIQRHSDLRPRRHRSIHTAVASGAAVVFLTEPDRRPTPDELRELTAFVSRGGRLVILDDARNANASTTDSWLAPFGLSTELAICGEERDFPCRAVPSPTGPAAAIAGFAGLSAPVGCARDRVLPHDETMPCISRLVARGGKPIMRSASGMVSAVSCDHERGRVFLYTRSSGLSDAVLGCRGGSIPEATQFAAERFAVELVQAIVGDLLTEGTTPEPGPQPTEVSDARGGE